MENITKIYNITTSISPKSETGEVFFVAQIVLSVMKVCLAVNAFLGNSLVLIALWKFRELRNPTNCYIASMSIADIFCGGAAIHCNLYGLLAATTEPSCMVCICLVCIGFGVSPSALLLVSLDRFVKIIWPMRYYSILNTRFVISTTAFVWGLYLGACVWVVLDHNDSKITATDCVLTELSRPYQDTYLVYPTLIIQIVGITVLNATICAVAWKQRKAIAALESSLQATSSTQHVQDYKLLKMVLIIVFTMYITYSPLLLLNMIKIHHKETRILCKNVVSLIWYFQAGINPWIYHMRIQQFRTAFRKILHLKS
jgi:hypothetical protein